MCVWVTFVYSIPHIYIRPKFVKSGMIIFYQILIVCGLERKCDCLKSVLLLFSYFVAVDMHCVNWNEKKKKYQKEWVYKKERHYIYWLMRKNEYFKNGWISVGNKEHGEGGKRREENKKEQKGKWGKSTAHVFVRNVTTYNFTNWSEI